MIVAILLYEGMTVLDAIGPYEVLSALPGAEVRFVAKSRGIVRADNRTLGLTADHALDDVTGADVLVIGGGPGDHGVMRDERQLAWVRAIDERTTWTTSVCTGALILGAAGLLRGKRATTHWFEVDRLREFGAEPVRERVVEDGKIITAAGVSAGIDMALTLAGRIAGDDVAQGIQLAIEYDPQPPFSSGSPGTAPKPVMDFVGAVFADVIVSRRAAFAAT